MVAKLIKTSEKIKKIHVKAYRLILTFVYNSAVGTRRLRYQHLRHRNGKWMDADAQE